MKRNVVFLVCLYVILFVLIVFIIYKLTGILGSSGGKIFTAILYLQLILVLADDNQQKKSAILFSVAAPVAQIDTAGKMQWLFIKRNYSVSNEYTLPGTVCIGGVENLAFVF